MDPIPNTQQKQRRGRAPGPGRGAGGAPQTVSRPLQPAPAGERGAGSGTWMGAGAASPGSCAPGTREQAQSRQPHISSSSPSTPCPRPRGPLGHPCALRGGPGRPSPSGWGGVRPPPRHRTGLLRRGSSQRDGQRTSSKDTPPGWGFQVGPEPSSGREPQGRGLSPPPQSPGCPLLRGPPRARTVPWAWEIRGQAGPFCRPPN